MKKIAVMVAICLLSIALFAQSGDVLSLQDAIALYEDDDAVADDGDRVIEIIKELIAEGINASTPDDENTYTFKTHDYGTIFMFDNENGYFGHVGYTPLIYAVRYGYTEIVKSLIAKGANIEAKSKDGSTALIETAEYGQTEAFKILINAGADIHAVTDMYGYDEGIHMSYYGNYTSLLYAVQFGRTEIAKLLITSGVNIDAQYNNGETALYMAAEKGNIEIVTALIEASAKLETTATRWSRFGGGTALRIAALMGHTEVVKALIEAGANVNAGNDFNQTPLMMSAAAGGDREIVTALIKAGADINTQVNSNWDNSFSGYTALIWAAKNGNLETVVLLIEAGANIDTIAGYSGHITYTALVLAIREGHTETVKALIEAGADVNVGTFMRFTHQTSGWPDDRNDYTPLMYASQLGHTAIVKLLISAGADINAKDSEGTTALMEATQNGHTDIVALLKKGRTSSQEIGKTYRTTDNLRLRQNEGTAGTPLFTLPKGASVKVLAQGNEETIDNITANWVQVEVLSDTVSVQGTKIEKGSVGWCFGGYLGEL